MSDNAPLFPTASAPVFDGAKPFSWTWIKWLQDNHAAMTAEMAPGRVVPFLITDTDVADTTKFDASGLGVGRYYGWAVCNGNNGTSDIGYMYGRHEDWRVVGDAGEPAFENSWVSYPGTTTRFRKLGNGLVCLQGIVSSGSAIPSTIFRLPSTHWPSKIARTAAASNSAFGYLRISTSGIVSAQVGSTTWFAVDAVFNSDKPSVTMIPLMRV